ncbi:MAG: methionine--tRNA ligase [Clostridia bacterium]|nr:methionine--tRNA ligase [Clostridia bacterium]
MKILIGGAWPYANYKLHLGHVAGLIGGDLLARYHRAKGDDVIFVSGSDCHGTPITERAKKENVTPGEICDKYHKEFVEAFDKISFSYDLYTKTETPYHYEKVKEIIKKIYDNGFIYEKVEPQAFCEKCNKFMADRELEITCPECGNLTKGDTCDCGYMPTEQDLLGATCRECSSKVIQKDNKNLYIALSKLQPEIQELVEKNKSNWRPNAQNETDKYLKEGLRDRAITRDLEWGIDVPIEGYDDKRLYVWIEAVLGYITATMKVCEDRGLDWEDYWKRADKIYMVHGKDNITFHSIIFPGLILALRDGVQVPDMIVSSEYLNFNDEKASKSKGNAISAIEMAEKYNSDTTRFHLINNGPERKDTNFNLLDYATTHNNEITNKYGNFVNRTLKFKGICEIPAGKLDEDIRALIEKAYVEIGEAIEKLEFKEASTKAIRLIEEANKFYDEKKPWVQFKEDMAGFNDTIYTCATLIVNIANIMEPFMPVSSEKIRKIFGQEKAVWNFVEATAGVSLENVEVLFTRIDEKEIIKEMEEKKAQKLAEEKKKQKEEKEKAKESAVKKVEEISIDYLDNIKLKVAKVLEAEEIEGSDKLLKLKVSLGMEERQIVAGIKKYYKPEELVGKKIVVVANLKPAKLRGVESQGMMLAAGDGDIVRVLTVDDEVEAGADVH